MTWKMEKNSDGQKPMLRRMGQIQSEPLEELKAQITGVTFDNACAAVIRSNEHNPQVGDIKRTVS
jgi:hypothetical protein